MKTLSLTLMLMLPVALVAQDKVVRLYIDADRTGTANAGDAIEWGVRTALAAVDNSLGGCRAEIVAKNHRGNTKRSRKHLEEFLQDDRALALFSGLHSAPLLANRSFINENEILILNPGAAAVSITRAATNANWIFRLSIDDSKAGYVIARHAAAQGFEKPFLLLEDTGWGKSNEATLSHALKALGLELMGVEWFQLGLGDVGAKILLRKIANSGADVIFLVANTPEGKTIANAMASLPAGERLSMRSHWGITGGDFPDVIDASVREHLDLIFLQTNFSFLRDDLDDFATLVLQRARAVTPIETAYDIKVPTGFIHAYDLTLLLIAAATQAKLQGDPVVDRQHLRNALEALKTPVRGLIKTYTTPFSPYAPERPDAHEALGIEDYMMGRYGARGEIILVD